MNFNFTEINIWKRRYQDLDVQNKLHFVIGAFSFSVGSSPIVYSGVPGFSSGSGSRQTFIYIANGVIIICAKNNTHFHISYNENYKLVLLLFL
ncbi:MAG: hypothetical protein ACI8Y7_000854 [Candidatus Woesearchaeota archaeon]|jgi:hypothetical protein